MDKITAIQSFNQDVGLIKATKIEANKYEVFLDEALGPPSAYRELISLLFNADESDSFVFYINTPGGDLFTARSIIEGMKDTHANVTGVLMGETHSGGSMIAMYCHGLAVLDSAEMMVHTAQFGSYGFTGNMKAHTNFAAQQIEKFIDETYEGFLTAEEITDVKKGVELWFGADEIKERIKTRMALLASRQEENGEES